MVLSYISLLPFVSRLNMYYSSLNEHLSFISINMSMWDLICGIVSWYTTLPVFVDGKVFAEAGKSTWSFEGL